MGNGNGNTWERNDSRLFRERTFLVPGTVNGTPKAAYISPCTGRERERERAGSRLPGLTRQGGKHTLQRPKNIPPASARVLIKQSNTECILRSNVKATQTPPRLTSTGSRLAGLMRTGGKHTLQRPKMYITGIKTVTYSIQTKFNAHT